MEAKKIVFISGSPRKKGTGFLLAEQLGKFWGDKVELEVLNLKDFEIKPCIGCLICQKKKGDQCPLKDDLPLLKDKILRADGAVYYSPAYLRMMTGPMKSFFDRLSGWIHRPVHGGKPALIISSASFGGNGETLKSLKIPVANMGYYITGRIRVLSTALRHNSRYKAKTEKKIEKEASRFLAVLTAEKKPDPRPGELLVFNKWQIKAPLHKDEYPGDYQHWKESGLLDKSYFYPCRTPFPANVLIPLLIRTGMAKLTGYVYAEKD